MTNVLFDSSVAIDILRLRPETMSRVERLRGSGDTPFTCAVVVEEVVRGLRPKEVARAHLLFKGLNIAPLGTAQGWLAGDWRRELSRRGRTLSQPDTLIAAAAAGVDAVVATGNPKDFAGLDVRVEHWPVNE